jgi:cyanophycinase-like exopeptidase
MPSERLPLYLLADSQLMFGGPGGNRLLTAIRALAVGSPRAAYIGASNGDDPAFYEIFTAAMEAIDVADCRMIGSSFNRTERAFLAQADIVLLAGGDVATGWRVFCATGMRDLIVERYNRGATVIGISAGAVQLGVCAWSEHEPETAPFDTFGICPFVVGAHSEDDNWASLVALVQRLDGRAAGLGIRRGAGISCSPDGRVDAIRHPADRLSWADGRVRREVVWPSSQE